MKLSCVLPFLFALSANAFQPISFPAISSRITTTLFANSKNIRAAMEATQLYGPTSVQARLAWETVEEFDANDNSAAYSGNEENKWTEEQLAEANQQIAATLQWLQHRTENLAANQMLMKDVAAELHAIKLTPPEKKPAPQIPGLWDAKLKARAITLQFGNYSPEAKVAWEEVEEIASAGLENAMGDTLSECWTAQAAEACLAFEELDRFIHYEYNKHYYQNEQQAQAYQQDQSSYGQQAQAYYQDSSQQEQYQQDQYQQQSQYQQDQYYPQDQYSQQY